MDKDGQRDSDWGTSIIIVSRVSTGKRFRILEYSQAVARYATFHHTKEPSHPPENLLLFYAWGLGMGYSRSALGSWVS